MARRRKSVEDLMYDNTVGVATGRTKRRGIQHKSPDENLWGSRNMNAADLKNPKSQYRRMADYRLTGRDSLANGQTAKELVREDAAYDQAAKANTARYINHRKKNTQGQAKLAGKTSGQVARKKIVGAVYGGTDRTRATKDRAGRKSFVEQQKSVGTMKNMIGKAKGKALSKGAKLPVKASTKVKNKLVKTPHLKTKNIKK